MKRIIPIVIILGLAVVVVIQYLKLRSLTPPDTYSYTLREDIDLDYYQPAVVGDYYASAREINGFVREKWYNEGVNVLMPDNEDPKAMDAARYFSQVQAYADSLGARLAWSLKYKEQGLSNADIRKVVEEGLSVASLQVEQTFNGRFFKKGDNSDGVWVLQELLIQKGYVMPHDGYYWEETQLAVREFQKKTGLPSTGVADYKTLNQLLKQ